MDVDQEGRINHSTPLHISISCFSPLKMINWSDRPAAGSQSAAPASSHTPSDLRMNKRVISRVCVRACVCPIHLPLLKHTFLFCDESEPV